MYVRKSIVISSALHLSVWQFSWPSVFLIVGWKKCEENFQIIATVFRILDSKYSFIRMEN